MNSCRSRLHREWSYQENNHWDRFQCHKYIETKEECVWAAKQLNLAYAFAGNGEQDFKHFSKTHHHSWNGEPAGKGCFTSLGNQGMNLYFRDPTLPPPIRWKSDPESWSGWQTHYTGRQSRFTFSLICHMPSKPVPSPPVGYNLTSLVERNLQMGQFDVSSFVKFTDTIFIFN